MLASASNERLVSALAESAAPWTDPSYSARARVIENLSATARLHPDMLARGLDFAFAAIGLTPLRTLLGEAEDPEALEHPILRPTGPARRLMGPRVAFHSLAGNVPGLSLPVIAASVLARSVAIVRDSARQPVLTEAFLETLAARDADAAAMIVPVRWESGDAAWEDDAFALAERAELYGSDATLRDLRRRHQTVRADIIERGTRLSLGFVPSSAPLQAAAEGFAVDITMYDGLGCLTPHAVIVSGRARASAFASQLAAALDVLEARWPRQARDFDDEAVRRAFIDACEVRCATRRDERLFRGHEDAWIVHEAGAEPPVLGPGLRCVRVIAADRDEEALAMVAGAAAPLAGIGLAGSPAEEPYQHIASRLRGSSATLVCAPGRMQAPPLTWTQDGRRRLGDLLSWRTEAV